MRFSRALALAALIACLPASASGILNALLAASSAPFTPVTQTFTTVGAHTITIPVGATTMTVEIFGPGGGGGGSSSSVVGQGGGSGARSASVVNVAGHASQTLTLVCGTAPVHTATIGNNGQLGGNSTVVVGTFSGSFTAMTAASGFGGQATLNGPGGGGTASGGNSANTTGNASTSQTGAAGLSGAFINGLAGGGGANHPGATAQPDTTGSIGQGAVHFT